MPPKPKNVTNQQVLDALRLMGYDIQGPLSMTGAQNSEWKNKLFQGTASLKALGQNYDAVFNKAVEAAKAMVNINPNASPLERAGQLLKAFGVSGEDMTKIVNEAKRIRSTSTGLYDRGTPFSDREYLQAAQKVLGNVPIVASTAKLTGLESAIQPLPPPQAVSPPPSQTIAATGGPQGIDPTAQVAKQAKPAAPARTAPTPTVTTNADGTVVDKGLPPNASPEQVKAYFRKNYGAEAWMLNIPDFFDVIQQVAKNPSGWSPASITSAVQQTAWWQQNGKSVADFLKRQANDPTGLNNAILQEQKHIEGIGKSFGMTLTPEAVLQMATDRIKWGWDDNQLNEAISQQWDWTQGQVSTLSAKMQTDARNYLVPIDEATIDAWGRRLIANPEAEAGNWKLFLAEQAKSMFPSFAPRLDAGEDMVAISKPYRDIASKWLEIDPNDVDFMNPKWMGALDQVDDKGNHTSMSYADWTRRLMNDPVYRYDYTQNAKESAAGLATGILQKFGAIGG